MVLSFYSKRFSTCEVEAATPDPRALRCTHSWKAALHRMEDITRAEPALSFCKLQT